MEEWKIQGSKEWLALRKTKVTATDSSVIMGLNPWSTPYKLWSRKLGLIEPEIENEAMRRGKEMEAEALEVFNDMNITCPCTPNVILHPENNWMMASLDGAYLFPAIKVVVEIKCGKKSFEQALNGIIPDYYMCQMQFQLACSGADMAYYFCFDGVSHGLHVIQRDEEFIAKMIAKCQEFYQCMLTLTPPELTDKDYVEVEDDYQLSRLSDLAALKREIKRLETQEKILDKQVKQFASDSQCNLKGSGLKISHRATKGTIDYKAIPELQGVDIEPYRKQPTQYWEIRLGD